MDPIIDAPVETAPQDQTTAQPDSQAGVITNTAAPTAAQLADAEKEFDDFYSDTPASAPGEESGAPVGDAAPSAAQPPVEPVPGGEQPPPEEPPVVMEAPGKLRVRLSHDDDIAIASLQRARGLSSFSEAARIYHAMIQASAPAAPDANGEQPAPPAQPSPTAELESQIAALAVEIRREREGDNQFTVEHLEKTDRLAEMRTNLALAKFVANQQAAAQQQSQEQAAQTARDNSYAAIRAEFPTLRNATSPLRQAFQATELEWAADPATAGRLSRPDAPQMLAREAAERVAAALVNAGRARTLDQALASLKPATAPPAAAPPKPPGTAPVPPSPAAAQARRVAPASGSLGQQNGGQPQTLAAAVAATNDPKELERLFDEMAENGSLAAARRR